jgi:hypothetical protein
LEGFYNLKQEAKTLLPHSHRLNKGHRQGKSQEQTRNRNPSLLAAKYTK